MNIENIVADYATKKDGKVTIDLEALARNAEFRHAVIEKVVSVVANKPQACVLIPAYKSGRHNRLGQLINELALTLQIKTLVTGAVENIKRLKAHPEEVLILKQSFREGKGLEEQISELKSNGIEKVSILCFLTHATGRMQSFGYENSAEIQAIVKLDGIRID